MKEQYKKSLAATKKSFLKNVFWKNVVYTITLVACFIFSIIIVIIILSYWMFETQ